MATAKNVVLLDESNYATWYPQIERELKRNGLGRYCSTGFRIMTPLGEMQCARAAAIIIGTVSAGLLVRIPKQDLLNSRALLGHLESFASPFRFLDLPPALRKLVYEHYFVEYHDSHYTLGNNINTGWKTRTTRMPALTQVCKKLRTETRSLYFGLCDFQFEFHFLEFLDQVIQAILIIKRWAREVAGPDLRHMRHLEISIGDGYCCYLQLREEGSLDVDDWSEEHGPLPKEILEHFSEVEAMGETLNLKGELLLMCVIQKPSIWVST